MNKDRPQGRQKYVSGGVADVHKRGSGLGTGPVGTGSAFQSGGSGGGGAGGPKRSGGGHSLLYIIIAAVVALGGGGGLLGGLFGGSGSDVAYEEPGSAYVSTQSGEQSGTFSQPQGGSAAQPSGGSAAQNAGNTLDTTVTADARAKRTNILGNGQDTVTLMVYMCGTDLESKYSMATKDLLEMTRASWGCTRAAAPSGTTASSAPGRTRSTR